jgi:hypothetical protein
VGLRKNLPLGSPIYELEVSARLRGVGLWRDADPVPPWEWRTGARNAHSAGEMKSLGELQMLFALSRRTLLSLCLASGAALLWFIGWLLTL